MIIGINGNEANVAHRVGVGQYAFELLRQFEQFKISNLKFKIYLGEEPLPDMPRLDYQVFGPKRFWTLIGLQKELWQKPPDILFTPTHYAPLYVPCPSVISIMDLAFEKFPQYFKPRDLYQLKYWTRYCARQAAKILTISEYSKKDICELYEIPESKVAVTYPGYDKERFNEKVKPGRKDRYLLYLGTLQPRKNIVRLIEAFSQLKTDAKLVVAGMMAEGRGGWMYQDTLEKAKSLRDRIEFTGYVPNEDVPGLMKGAIAYVLPSLYEGFGIPAIEAMACGTPVLVSKVSSLPEICGEAATYIDDPSDIDSIKQGLKEVLEKGSEKVNLGLEWVKRYNWEETAKKTLEVLENACG